MGQIRTDPTSSNFLHVIIDDLQKELEKRESHVSPGTCAYMI